MSQHSLSYLKLTFDSSNILCVFSLFSLKWDKFELRRTDSKYSIILTPYHTYPKFKSVYFATWRRDSNCWMDGKQQAGRGGMGWGRDNGIKETNTATGSDNDRKCRNDWSQSMPMTECTIAEWVANNVDPDQTPLSVSSDQGLHCLLKSVYPNT